ncbi:MAG: hypothetical protein JWQ94_3265 [Tardiphaga sp.]|jgi:hypothetical protein|nr:hypothetical protein [Tardiphaga sp.]
MQAINIVTVVDVISALSKGSLHGSLHMMDTSWCSEHKGTADLATACYPGQHINWIVHAIDVQTPVLISAINILNGDNDPAVRAQPTKPQFGGAPHWFYWSGVVPYHLAPGLYHYRLKLQLGRGIRSALSIDTPALNVLSFVGPEPHHEPATGNHSDDR